MPNNLFNPNGQPNEIPESSESNVDFGKLPGIFGFAFGLLQTIIQQSLNDRATVKLNEYNSPAAQMSRLRAAGINPYSAFQQVASQNTSAPRQSAQVRFQEGLNNIVSILQMQALQEDVRGKQIQNDILSNNLQFQRSHLQNRQKSEYLRIAESELRNQYLNGTISLQQLNTRMAELRNFANDLVVYQGEDGSWASNFFGSLRELGFTNLPDNLSIGQIDSIVDMLSKTMSQQFNLQTFENRVDMTQFQRDILEKNKEMIIEQLEHLKSVNDKYEKWFLFNQIIGAASQILSIFGGGVNAAQGIQHMIFNPYNPNGPANQ